MKESMEKETFPLNMPRARRHCCNSDVHGEYLADIGLCSLEKRMAPCSPKIGIAAAGRRLYSEAFAFLALSCRIRDKYYLETFEGGLLLPLKGEHIIQCSRLRK